MRKLKADSNKAHQIAVTLPKSLANHIHGVASRWIQQKIAEDVLGVGYSEFLVAVKSEQDVRFVRDPWEKEFVRCARWIKESTIISASSEWVTLENGDKACYYVHLYVRWNLSNVETLVRINLRSSLFSRVCYDEIATDVYPFFGDEVGMELPVTGNSFKLKVLRKWLSYSGWGHNDEGQWVNPDMVAEYQNDQAGAEREEGL